MKDSSEQQETLTPRVQAIVIVPIAFVYARLVCEFSHWDQCLTGLIRLHGGYWVCRMVGDYHGKRYRITPVEWAEECEQYLADYRATYHHWFYVNGKRPSYDGRPLGSLRDKWGDRNPILEQSR